MALLDRNWIIVTVRASLTTELKQEMPFKCNISSALNLRKLDRRCVIKWRGGTEPYTDKL